MTFHLMGGDRRQGMLASYIAERGFEVSRSFPGGEPCWDADILVLPLPCTKDGLTLFAPQSDQTIALTEIFKKFHGQMLFGGMLPPDAPPNAIDYYRSEPLQLFNANATAEGALALAIERTPFTLFGNPALILGAGRIGQFLAAKLSALGARVTVGARREEALALCRARGWEARRLEDLCYKNYRLVFNTIPARILGEEQLGKLPRGALLMELASAPGGFDPETALEHHLRVCYAPGLPGKYSPESAAGYIGETILKEMERNG